MDIPKGYKLFYVSVPIDATAQAYVYAKDAEDAKAQAAEHTYIGLCHECSNSVEICEAAFDDSEAEATEVEDVPRWCAVANEDALLDKLGYYDD